MVLILFSAGLRAQTASDAVTVCVRDRTGAAVADAEVLTPGGAPDRTDATGCVRLLAPHRGDITVRHAGFAETRQPLTTSATVAIVLQPEAVSQQVTVTDARLPLESDASATSVLRLPAERLLATPGVTLDDRLREIAGFQLFRRTSSLVANPTTQGTSLRGLGSTAASRTLVLSDTVPLTDGFGGWVHWNEIPELAIDSITVARGGASDLYGSSAIGGVIEVAPVTPERSTGALDLAGGSESTSSLNGLGTLDLGSWQTLAAASVVHSDGYILTAPAFRGPVDTAANVHSESGRIELRRDLGISTAVFVRGNLLNEARGNGTPSQTNATRIWTYVAGGDWSPTERQRLVLRASGNRQGYRQSFSSVSADRSSETLTRLQRVPYDQFGGTAQWAGSVRSLAWVVGADLNDTRATDAETPVHAGILQTPTIISARQRQTGGYGELLWQSAPIAASGRIGLRQGWSAALSGRVDSFRSFDAHTATAPAVPTPLPGIDETIFDPRLGLTKQLRGGVSLNASVFRAFRGPTMNELYRTGQVGQQITLANSELRSERATGFEAGALAGSHRWGSVRGSWFWTEVNRPITALTIASTPTTLTQMRENLGQLRSRGITAEWQLTPVPFLELTGGYQLAISTITRFDQQPALVGSWTAQVPRNTATAQARFQRSHWGSLLLDLRSSGRQYDSAGNSFELHSFTALNAFAEHRFRHGLSVYASGLNLFDRSIEAGRTPVLTLAQPRTVLGGIRLGLR